jgi:hypothetical protein
MIQLLYRNSIHAIWHRVNWKLHLLAQYEIVRLTDKSQRRPIITEIHSCCMQLADCGTRIPHSTLLSYLPCKQENSETKRKKKDKHGYYRPLLFLFSSYYLYCDVTKCTKICYVFSMNEEMKTCT